MKQKSRKRKKPVRDYTISEKGLRRIIKDIFFIEILAICAIWVFLRIKFVH